MALSLELCYRSIRGGPGPGTRDHLFNAILHSRQRRAHRVHACRRLCHPAAAPSERHHRCECICDRADELQFEPSEYVANLRHDAGHDDPGWRRVACGRNEPQCRRPGRGRAGRTALAPRWHAGHRADAADGGAGRRLCATLGHYDARHELPRRDAYLHVPDTGANRGGHTLERYGRRVFRGGRVRMIVRRAIFADLPAIRVGFAHLVAELEAHRLVPYPAHDMGTLDDFTVHLAGRVGVDPRLLLYVALEDATHALLGFLGGEVSERLLGYPTRYGAAHWLYVAPGHRGQGVARALVRLACQDLEQLGITHVELASLTGDEQWLRRGWAPYLVHFVLPLEAVIAGAVERSPVAAPALEPAPAREVPPPPESLAANGNGQAPAEGLDEVLAGLSTRARTVLRAGGYVTVSDILTLTRKQLRRQKNCGPKTIAELLTLVEALRHATTEPDAKPC